MSAYVVVEIVVNNPEGYEEYKKTGANQKKYIYWHPRSAELMFILF